MLLCALIFVLDSVEVRNYFFAVLKRNYYSNFFIFQIWLKEDYMKVLENVSAVKHAQFESIFLSFGTAVIGVSSGNTFGSL